MSENWDKGMCNERSGFLFHHGCDRPEVAQCNWCGKPICVDHSTPTAEGTMCTTCAKGYVKQHGTTKARDRDDDDDRPYYTSPYFYGGYYYPYYGRYHSGHWGSSHYSDIHDSSDFTEADAESLAATGDEDFETDFGES